MSSIVQIYTNPQKVKTHSIYKTSCIKYITKRYFFVVVIVVVVVVVVCFVFCFCLFTIGRGNYDKNAWANVFSLSDFYCKLRPGYNCIQLSEFAHNSSFCQDSSLDVVWTYFYEDGDL